MTADIQDQQGGYDPWWQTKTGGANVEQAILFKCDVGKIFKSTDGGQSWNNVTPTTDPPNTWGDITAPTVANLTFIQRVDNIHVEDQHIFLCQQTGADRAWLLKTTDGGVIWSWTPMTVVDYDGTYLYPVGAKMVCVNNAGNCRIENSVANIPGAPDGNTAYWEKGNCGSCPANGLFNEHLFVDWGVSLSGTVEIEIRTRGDQASAGQDLRYSNTDADYTSVTRSSIGSGTWTNLAGDAETWYGADSTLTWYSTGSFSMASPYRYLRYRIVIGPESDGVQLHVDALRATATVTIPDTIPLWMDLDVETGDYLYITYWANDELWLQKRSTSSLAILDTISLGAATEAEVNALSYVAWEMTPAFDQNVIFCFGRMQSPQSLSNPEHLIWTQDGGATWASLVNSLGADHIGAFQAWQQGDVWRYVFVRNISGGNGEFWGGTTGTTPTKLADLPFQVGVDAMTIKDSSVAVGCKAAGGGGEAIYISSDLGLNWSDATGTHPAGSSGEIKSLVYV